MSPENLQNAWNRLVGEREEHLEDVINLKEDLDKIVDLLPRIAEFFDCDGENEQA